MNEETLIEIFKKVGTVIGFRLVFDRETGKPRGYGFCEFADHETALSAVRNLNNVDCGGRPLRIDLADSDPFLEGKTTVRGELVDNSGGWRERHRDSDRDRDFRHGSRSGGGTADWLSSLPRGTPLLPGQSCMDAISQTVASIRPNQMMEILSSMKTFIIEQPDKARILLTANPQLAYALFQALLVNQIVDPAILHRMIAATNPGSMSGPPPPQTMQHGVPPPPVHPTPTPASALPPHLLPSHAQPPYPPHQPTPPAYSTPPPSTHLGYPPPPSVTHSQPPFYHPPPPPPPPPSVPPAQPAPASSAEAVPEAQRAMLMQMLSLSNEQINALPPNERQAIQQLVKKSSLNIISC
ncbi:hypothetical protein Clacol_002054 [Clathrus columnatus]|uniref:RRM domain-containing protein n=1 Tax=Clathrus columnatus TaxID=1419009 RepID=A0AAV5A2Y7_9AGAM|nr:hypothetical protein Clacol_002054 [Clathrus columnatus]